MVMYFQDDFWEAISKLKSKEDQDAAIVALVRYHFDRSEPSNPIADAILTVCKDRIELSQKRSKAGATRKQNKSKKETKPEQNETSPSLSLSPSISKYNSKSVCKVFDEAEQAEPSHAVLCLKGYNETLGRDVSYIPQESVDLLNMRADKYTVDDVIGMVKMKREQWEGTKIESNLKPSTLFSLKHFDEYMEEYKHQNDEREFSDDEIPY